MTEKSKSGALSDIKVLEMGQLIAGPFCGQLLGDMGAEVIKVEMPEVGDPLRQWGRGDVCLWWEVVARNKKSVSLDLRTLKGQELIRGLVKNVDILIENFRPGTLERWNLSPESLLEINPRLIIVRISGYGQYGPYSGRPGYGGIGEAIGGWRALVGEKGRAPVRMGVSIGDSLAATYGCLGALCALHARHNTGKGQVIDMALYEAVLQVMESLIPEYVHSGYVREPTGPTLENVAPSNVYKCQDGQILIAANQDAVFSRLATAMNMPELASDARYSSHKARGINMEELDSLIDQWTSSKALTEVESIMLEHAVPFGRIFRASDMLEDPHFAARNAIVEMDRPGVGKLAMQNVFPKLSETPGSVRSPAPSKIGQDNVEIYSKYLNFSKEELEELEKDKIV